MAVLNYRACSCALAMLSLTGCEFTRDPTAITLTDDRVAVHSVLTAGDTTARVLLSLVPATWDPNDPFAMRDWIPVTNAQVRVTMGADTIVLTVGSDTTVNPCFRGALSAQTPARELRAGCYTARVPDGIASGAEFGLLIELPGRGSVRGSTIIPAPPTITQPQSGAVLPEAHGGSPTFPVEWTGLPTGRVAALSLAARHADCIVYVSGGVFINVESRLVTDVSSVDVGASVQCTEPVERVPADVVLTAFDVSYSRHLETLSQNKPMSDAVLGFTGPAIGVFGSAASARQPVWFE